MNCKPGDLAVYVGPCPVGLGLIRRIVRADCVFRGAWIVDPPYPPNGQGSRFSAWDEHLRPIRPGDISDEEVRDLYLPGPVRTKETA